MNNKPFQFSSSKRDLDRLVVSLEEVGAELESTDQEYTSIIWNLKCPWMKANSIKLVWDQEWWSDGMEKEDVGVHLIKDENNIFSIRFSELVSPEGGNLRDKISLAIIGIVGHATGKNT